MGLPAVPRVSGAKVKPLAQCGTMAVVRGQQSVTGSCYHLGSLLQGTNGACLLHIAGVPAGRAGCRQLSCPRPHAAVLRHRWWQGRTCHLPPVALPWSRCWAGAA